MGAHGALHSLCACSENPQVQVLPLQAERTDTWGNAVPDHQVCPLANIRSWEISTCICYLYGLALHCTYFPADLWIRKYLVDLAIATFLSFGGEGHVVPLDHMPFPSIKLLTCCPGAAGHYGGPLIYAQALPTVWPHTCNRDTHVCPMQEGCQALMMSLT